MAQFVNMFKVDLKDGPAIVQLNYMGLGDALANRIGAIVTDGGEAASLSGTCSGTAILSNGGTVALTGTISGNQAYVDLPSAAYAVEGPIEVFVCITASDTTTTLVAGMGNVRRTQTGTVIDPGTVIPSVSALIEAIEDAVDSIPADYSALLATIAPTFSSSTAYAAGTYAWHSDTLYRFTADHAAGSWTGSDAVAVVVGTELASLKSAVTYGLDNIREGTVNLNTAYPKRQYPSGSGVITESSSNKYMGMGEKIPCSAQTDYSFSIFDSGVSSASTLYVAWYGSDGTFISRDDETLYSTDLTKTITSPQSADMMIAAIRNSDGVSDNTKIMIVSGSTPATEYTKPYTALDLVARQLPSEHSLNIADTLPISKLYATYENDGNGYKVICAEDTKLGQIRFQIYSSVTNDDVGKTFTLSADLISKTGTDTRITFLSNNSNRKSTSAASAGSYSLTYEITSNDVGRALYAALYAAVTTPLEGQYSVWHNIQVVESALVLPFMTKKTCIDSTARKRLAEIGNVSGLLSKQGITLTEDTTYYIKTEKACPYLLKCRAKYAGTQPTITFGNSLYTSPSFDIGGSEYKMQSWRIPPDLMYGNTTITITIPSGSSLVIDYLYAEENAYNPANHEARPVMCAHLGFTQMCPQNTKPGFEMAGMLGYPALIITPQITQDGEIVCIHDETINATAVDADGNAPSTEMAVIDMTYSQLLEWDFGRKKNVYWTGAKIPTFEDFLQVCAKYGMAPVISTHPNVTPSVWGEKCADIKALLIKYGLLDKFVVKAFDIRYINASYAVFGQDIGGYVGEHGDNYVTITQLQSFVSTNSIDTKKCHVASEKSINTITESYVGDVLTAGLECGCYTITSSHSASTIKQLISYGVTSFTDDTYCQNGMDW